MGFVRTATIYIAMPRSRRSVRSCDHSWIRRSRDDERSSRGVRDSGSGFPLLKGLE